MTDRRRVLQRRRPAQVVANLCSQHPRMGEGRHAPMRAEGRCVYCGVALADVNPRDSQRQRVYRWEESLLRQSWMAPWRQRLELRPMGRRYDQSATVRLVWRIWRGWWGPRPPHRRPEVVIDRQRVHPAAWSYRSIHLPPLPIDYESTVHEVAHTIVAVYEHRHACRVAQHGPEFVRVLIELLAAFRPPGAELPQGALLGLLSHSARLHRVAVADSDEPYWRRL